MRNWSQDRGADSVRPAERRGSAISRVPLPRFPARARAGPRAYVAPHRWWRRRLPLRLPLILLAGLSKARSMTGWTCCVPLGHCRPANLGERHLVAAACIPCIHRLLGRD